ncbi:MAG: hypothetical protein ACYC91_10495 [Solirubrobacteraceae bacterium]
MASIEEKIEAEVRIRQLLAQENVPAPDRIEYGYTCIRLLWEVSKVALVIDIDEVVGDASGAGFEVDVFPREE